MTTGGKTSPFPLIILMNDAITDIDGLLVGQSQLNNQHHLTGVTLIIPEKPCCASYALRGGAPASRELHLLEPEKLVQKIDAICLSGGSAYGLAAADALMLEMRAQGRGFKTKQHVVPIIPAVSLFDLTHNSSIADYRALAREAWQNQSDKIVMGNQGAGTGATSGLIKGGVGSASAESEILSTTAQPIKVGALVAVNSFGSTIINQQGDFYGAHFMNQAERQLLPSLSANNKDNTPIPVTDELQLCKNGFPQNTSLAVIATNLALDKAQLKALANSASDGLARAIYPCHTLFDGDIVFALSTAQHSVTPDTTTLPQIMVQLASLAAKTLSRAVIRAILSAESTHNISNYNDFIKKTL